MLIDCFELCRWISSLVSVIFILRLDSVPRFSFYLSLCLFTSPNPRMRAGFPELSAVGIIYRQRGPPSCLSARLHNKVVLLHNAPARSVLTRRFNRDWDFLRGKRPTLFSTLSTTSQRVIFVYYVVTFGAKIADDDKKKKNGPSRSIKGPRSRRLQWVTLRQPSRAEPSRGGRRYRRAVALSDWERSSFSHTDSERTQSEGSALARRDTWIFTSVPSSSLRET